MHRAYFGLVRQKGNERDKWGKHPINEFRFVFVERMSLSVTSVVQLSVRESTGSRF